MKKVVSNDKIDIYKYILKLKEEKGGVFFLLIDPDKIENHPLFTMESIPDIDIILVGTSFAFDGDINELIKSIKARVDIPVVIFPGGAYQLSPNADAVLFTSLISGRNPRYLIEEQVSGAPFIKKHNIQPIPTGYILIESGKTTTIQFISNTLPIPRDNTELILSHALAGQYLGMKMIYYEAGSGASNPVPLNVIKKSHEMLDIPFIAGGGIKTPDVVSSLVQNGATGIVIGNILENSSDYNLFREMVKASHPKIT